MEKLILHLLLKINRLYPYNGLRDSILRRPLFLTNTGKRDATVTKSAHRGHTTRAPPPSIRAWRPTEAGGPLEAAEGRLNT